MYYCLQMEWTQLSIHDNTFQRRKLIEKHTHTHTHISFLSLLNLKKEKDPLSKSHLFQLPNSVNSHLSSTNNSLRYWLFSHPLAAAVKMADLYGNNESEDMSSFLQILMHNSNSAAPNNGSAPAGNLFGDSGVAAESSSSINFSDSGVFFRNDGFDPANGVSNCEVIKCNGSLILLFGVWFGRSFNLLFSIFT